MSSWRRAVWSLDRCAQRGVRWVLRAAWFGVIPGLLGALTVRYAVPNIREAQGTWAEPLARVLEPHAPLTWLALMLLFASLFRYWAAWLTEAGVLPSSVLGIDARRTNGGRSRGDLLRLLGVAFAVVTLAWAFRATVGSSYEVLGGSMLPTLEPGDLVAGSRLAYGLRVPGGQATLGARTPRRGEIIVAQNPEPAERSGELIKRVIGLPGDRIQMRGNVPVINGFRVPGCDAGYYLHASHHLGAHGRVFVEFLDESAYLALYAATVPEFDEVYVVPPGQLFVLGDNRGDSVDSRAWNGGKGRGVEVTHVDARVFRFLAARRLDDRVDLGLFGRRIELEPHFAEVELGALRDGIAACLRQRPTDTSPPGADADRSSVASSPVSEP